MFNRVNPGHTVLQSKRKLVKNPECEKYIQYSETCHSDSVFQGKGKVAQKSWMVKIYSMQWKISRQTLFFSASGRCSKILIGENIFNTEYSVYIHLGLIGVIWASVMCNLDQRGDWL